MLTGSLQAAQSNNRGKDRNYENKALVQLFEIQGIGLVVVKYISCEDGYKALQWSVRLEYLCCADDIMEQGAISDKRGEATLHQCRQEVGFDYLNRLLQQGTDISTINGVAHIVEQDAYENSWKDKALHLSAEKGHLEVMKYLVSKGVYIDAENNGGNSVLRLRTIKGHSDIVAYIHQQEAAIYEKNNV